MKRLRRLEIRNLQQNAEALHAFQALFAGDALNVDEDDVDLGQLDTMIMYYHPQFNELNADTYNRDCNDRLELTASRVIDATDPYFLLQMVDLVSDLKGKHELHQNGIDHFYAPNLRGQDSMHLMHLALMNYAFSGEQQYKDFLDDVLLEDLRAAEMAMLTSALVLPPFCRRFYGTNITIGPLWSLINLLGDSPLKTHMQKVMHREEWQKENHDLGNVRFNIMYAGVVPPGIATDADAAAAYAIEQLGLFDDHPRRDYRIPLADMRTKLGERGIDLRCATSRERHICEDGVDVFGLHIDGEIFTHTCDGRPNECFIETDANSDDLCGPTIAASPLPMDLRAYGDFIWQRDPYQIDYGSDGREQSPGVDYIEAYWMARHHGLITEGAGQVLAWRDEGSCE